MIRKLEHIPRRKWHKLRKFWEDDFLIWILAGIVAFYIVIIIWFLSGGLAR